MTIPVPAPRLTKEQAIEIFGGKQRYVAEALGVTPSAISQWPDGELDQAVSDRLIGAAIRLGKQLPPDLLCSIRPPAQRAAQ